MITIPWRADSIRYLTLYLKSQDVVGTKGSFDLTNVSETVLYIQKYGENTIRVTGTMGVVSATQGIVRYLLDATGWPEGDYMGEVFATTADGEKIPTEFFTLRVEKSLPR